MFIDWYFSFYRSNRLKKASWQSKSDPSYSYTTYIHVVLTEQRQGGKKSA